MSALAALRALWDCGVHRVSPGALGMNMHGAILSDEATALLGAQLGIRWDGAWLVMTARP